MFNQLRLLIGLIVDPKQGNYRPLLWATIFIHLPWNEEKAAKLPNKVLWVISHSIFGKVVQCLAISWVRESGCLKKHVRISSRSTRPKVKQKQYDWIGDGLEADSVLKTFWPMLKKTAQVIFSNFLFEINFFQKYWKLLVSSFGCRRRKESRIQFADNNPYYAYSLNLK